MRDIDKKMNWFDATLFCVVGGAASWFLVNHILLSRGDCGTSALVKATVFTLPVGEVPSITLYRILYLRCLRWHDIGGVTLGLLLAMLLALVVFPAAAMLFAAGPMLGLLVALAASSLGSLLGYRMVVRHETPKSGLGS
jgi:hypothetical protein